MKKWALIAAFAATLLLGGSIAYRVWAVNANPAPGSIWTWLGPTLGADWAAPAAPATSPLRSPMDYGCVGDGVADDTTCLQAAITDLQGAASGGTRRNILWLGDKCYGISHTVTITGPITIQGNEIGSRNNRDACNSGIRALAANFDHISILATATGATLRDFTMVTAAAVRPNASGIAIHNRAADAVVRDVSVFYPCVGVSEGGNGNNYEHMIIGPVLKTGGANCVGILVGADTIGANTVDPRFVSNLIEGDTDPAHYGRDGGKAGMEIRDCGGCFNEMNDILFLQIGTLFAPGANQVIVWGFWNNTVAGDTDYVNDLVFRPTSNVGTSIWGLQFTGTWAANASNGATIVIDNTVGAQLSGIRFLGHRSYSHGTSDAGPNPNNIVEYIPGNAAGSDGISFLDSAFCTQYSNSTGVGIKVTGTLYTSLTIRGNRIGQCDHGAATGTLATGISLTTGSSTQPSVITITDNNFQGVTTPLAWTPNGENAIIRDNTGIQGAAPSGGPITAAATITLPVYKRVAVSGTTPIQTINGMWFDREVQLVAQGGVNFTSGGNLCSGFPTSIPDNRMLDVVWGGGCWFVR